MNIRKVYTLTYSATGNTALVTEVLGKAMSETLQVPFEQILFTKPAERKIERIFTKDDLVIVGFPTYAGKLPNKILPDFQNQVQGNGAMAVAVVTFGNRSYDHALAQLCAALQAKDFCTVAAGAFVCRHAFTDELAYGRPGWSDQFELKNFAGDICRKLQTANARLQPVQVPGDPEGPYYVPTGLNGAPADFLKATPKTNLSKCSRCGACVRICPMGAIDARDVTKVTGTCIKCQACVRKCTKNAKYFDDPAFLSHVAMLERNHTDPKENEMFL